jgi:hypothetical protein
LILQSVLIVAAYLVLLMILVLLTNRGDRGRGTFAYFIVNVAALPILASALFVFWLGNSGHTPSEYWATAPWLVIFAATQYSGYAAVLAVVTGVVYLLARGDNAKRARWSLGCFTILFPAMFAFLWHQQFHKKLDLRDVQAGLVHFTARAPEVTRVVSGPISAHVLQQLDGEPRYIVEAISESTPDKAFVVVDAVDNSGLRFKVACVIPRGTPWDLEAPCAKPERD